MCIYIYIYIYIYGPTSKPSTLLKRTSANFDTNNLFALPTTNVKQQVFCSIKVPKFVFQVEVVLILHLPKPKNL